jgi:hypothetical protein
MVLTRSVYKVVIPLENFEAAIEQFVFNLI